MQHTFGPSEQSFAASQPSQLMALEAGGPGSGRHKQLAQACVARTKEQHEAAARFHDGEFEKLGGGMSSGSDEGDKLAAAHQVAHEAHKDAAINNFRANHAARSTAANKASKYVRSFIK